MANVNTNFNNMFNTFSYFENFATYYPTAIIIGIICGIFKFHKYFHQITGINTEETYDEDLDDENQSLIV